MKKGYMSISPTEKGYEELDEKNTYYSFYSDTTDKLPKQKGKMTKKTRMKKTRGVRVLFTLVFFTISMFFIHRFIRNYSQLAIPFQTAFDLVRNIPSSDHLRSHFMEYASSVHPAGSEQDYKLATWTRDQWIQFGVTDTRIETYYPLLNHPKTRRLAIVQGKPELLFEASLEEKNQTTFHAYSASGNVTGPLVYVNYGEMSDFNHLQSNGVVFKGAIALIRHGLIPRGLKIKLAQDYGCIGVILFTDSSSSCDNHWHSKLVERGSVQFVSFGVGDPSTPGYAAKSMNETRAPFEASSFIPRIPSLPISWEDAMPLLKATEGLGLSSEGACKTYFSGPSEALVQLVNINEYKAAPIWNVIGTIPGSEEPNRTVILGNHRDAWGYGAVDPSSGSAVMMELVRTLGVLLERGWRPKRTIIVASWDAEEYGTVGSVEWIEDHASWLKEQAVAYINVDYAVSGKHFAAQASPLLRRLLYEVTDQVIDPESSVSVLRRWRVERGGPDMDMPLTEMLSVDSDHVGFFHHLGVSSISMGFRGPHYDVHHSEFDSIEWMQQQDPLFEYHQTLTKIWGMLVLRLSSDSILPFHPQDYTKEIVKYVQRVGSQQGCLTFPYISSALHSLAATSIQFERTMRQRHRQLRIRKHVTNKLIKQVDEMNARLARFESSFLDEQGLDRARPWFKHMVYGPQLETGLTVPFPSLLEAVEKDDIVHIQWVEERIGNVLIQADRILKGQFNKPDSKHDNDEEDDDFYQQDD